MVPKFEKTKPSFLEGGLPCASLSAECQRDNSAATRPPQNTLHIWWARRPPTICRAAILSSLLPYDLDISDSLLPSMVSELSVNDIDSLPKKFIKHKTFIKHLVFDLKETELSCEHKMFLRIMGIKGDVALAEKRIKEANCINPPLLLGDTFGYLHSSAFSQAPNGNLVKSLLNNIRHVCGLEKDENVIMLDSMAGGGSIPIEGVRYGLKVFANDLNPVASLILKGTIEYPLMFSHILFSKLKSIIFEINKNTNNRLKEYFFSEPYTIYWDKIYIEAKKKFTSKQITKIEPGGDAWSRFYLWARKVKCSSCNLNIPICTNFLVSKRDLSNENIAAFPEVPHQGLGNDCVFKIVKKSKWKECRWPNPDFTEWHPSNTPTFKSGNAICPRCNHIMTGDEVKELARQRSGGLPTQMYAVCSQVPVKLTYRNGEEKVRYLWRFRAPTLKDLDAVEKAEKELARLLPKWEAQGLVPNEEVPEDMEDKRPRDYGMTRWRDLFLPRQLLTNMVILEEIRETIKRVQLEFANDQTQLLSLYLSFCLSKIVNYNSVNCFWHYGHNKTTQTFSRHDFAFRPAFCEMNGSSDFPNWSVEHLVKSLEGLKDLYQDENNKIRDTIIKPTITCEDAAALSIPEPGSVHLICVDPPYYNNVQYSELSNFFYVWLKRVLGDVPGLESFFTEPLADSNREAVANKARWQRDADREIAAWQERYDAEFEALRAKKVKVKDAKEAALQAAGPKPTSAKDRADQFYEDKMASVFRRGRQLLHPAGRMVVMFNHKQTWAWRSLGMALIRAGFEIKSSAPIHTEAESSLNIRGLDAARSTVLLLCVPREEAEQPAGNWGTVQGQVARVAQAAAERFQSQGLSGTDLYLSVLGPALGVVGKNWPVTDFSGQSIDLSVALDEAYLRVGQWRLQQILDELTRTVDFGDAASGFSAHGVDKDTQTLWLWVDTFQGEIAQSDDVQKLAKSLGVDPAEFKKMGLLDAQKDLFMLRPPQDVDLRLLSRKLLGETIPRGRSSREADIWEERRFPKFVGAAVWNAIALMHGTDLGPAGVDALRRWVLESGYRTDRDFFGAFAVTLHLLEKVFGNKPDSDPWRNATIQARRAWDLHLKTAYQE
jgi:putative DNA methylase